MDSKDIITEILKFLLGVWAKELNAREDYLKQCVQGTLKSATHQQTESSLRVVLQG
jgi:pre-mRNA-splicing factor 18